MRQLNRAAARAIAEQLENYFAEASETRVPRHMGRRGRLVRRGAKKRQTRPNGLGFADIIK